MRANMRITTTLSLLFTLSSAQAQIITTGQPVNDCNQQWPRLFLNSAHFRVGNTAKITVQGPKAGDQTLFLVATTDPEKVFPQGSPLGVGNLVSYIDLTNAVIVRVSTDQSGSAELTLPIAQNSSLVGLNLFFQVFSLENPKCSGPLAYSNSPLRRVTIGSDTSSFAPPTMSNSVTSGSITWTFDRTVETGTFYNGHRWVKGPLRVVSISPAPAGGRNGSMIDPSALGLQAYDGRRNYDASLAATPATLDFTGSTSIRSLVSTVSTPAADTNRFLQEVQVLTVIPADQPNPGPGAFRPSYHHGEKIMISVEDLIEERHGCAG